MAIKAVVFDMDGVIYRGSQAIAGVPQEIARLQKKAKVLFLTNNATKSRADYVFHLRKFGIRARSEEIMTSAFGVAHYIREKFGRGKQVFAIGENGLLQELELEAGARLAREEGKADIVVCALDRQLTYEKLAQATNHLARGAYFIVANSDPALPLEFGYAPGSGAIAAALITASGRQPDAVVGKPSTYLIDKLLEMHKIKPSEAAFVGDRLDADIRMANKKGMLSVLVLSGVAKKPDVKKAPKKDRPSLVLPTAAKVGRALSI
ncbi:MAG: HAD-IIA family hydrolase [Candidatus Micrarchaeota archaeon]|nr:HAD-IIA family hydrolase [Candidatus Micrarchaeota archaeon]